MRSYFLHAPLAGHVAGQYLDVRLTAPDGYQARRSYSIASRPGAAELELAIALQDDGEVSAWFHEVAQPGDTIDVRGPLGGHFIWEPPHAAPVLLVAGGSGIVPLVSIARAWQAAPAAPMLLLHSARTPEALAFQPELAGIAAADPRFTYVAVSTRAGTGRRIDAAMLDKALGHWGHLPALCYLCGPTAFVEAVAQLLVARGVAHRAIRTERFG
ncbi:oxidoreductase [Pseudoduganella plicata]|nr:oxidoreductase [Pseudoduganella plicata]